MNILFVYDATIDRDAMGRLPIGPEDRVCLFSLTSKTRVNDAVSGFCSKTGAATETIDSARSINASAENLRERYLKFIAELPDKVSRNGKGLKQLFSIDGHMTLWWSSLISEKSTYKSDAFFRLTQLDAIICAIGQAGAEKIVCGFDSARLEKALSGYCDERGLEINKVRCKPRRGFKGVFKDMRLAPYAKHVILLSHSVIQMFVRSVRIKLIFHGIKRPGRERSLALVTYYPNIDLAQAKKGIFRNRFWSNLQESLAEDKVNVTWIALYVPNNAMSFGDAMRYAVAFVRNGNAIYFIEEFLSLRGQCTALLVVIKMGLRFMRIENDIRNAHRMDGYNFYELFRDDWYSSFAGATCYLGMLYYGIFRKVASGGQWSACLYPCEMHAWEKALVAAFRNVAPRLKLYAYQSGTVSRMLLSYFNHPLEIADDGAYSIPKPDKVICDGSHPLRCMMESGWTEQHLMLGEAIRYSHLKKHMNVTYPKKNIVLLALSISPDESNSILTLASEALRGMEGIEVWIKPHPFLDMDRVLGVSGLSESDLPFIVKKDPIDALLPEARIMVAGESGVSIEALAFGCGVITVSVPEWIEMSPLKHDRSGIARHVRSPEELKAAVKDMIENAREPETVRAESARILNDYLCLDHASDRPSRIMELFR